MKSDIWHVNWVIKRWEKEYVDDRSLPLDTSLWCSKIVPAKTAPRPAYSVMDHPSLPVSESRHANQSNAIDEQTKSKFIDHLLLNQLISKYLGQNGSEVDSLSRLLDGRESSFLFSSSSFFSVDFSNDVGSFGQTISKHWWKSISNCG